MIENSDDEFSDRADLSVRHQPARFEDSELDLEEEWLDLDNSEAEDDASFVSDLFRQISQETPATADLPETPETVSAIAQEPVKEDITKVEPKPQKLPLLGVGLAFVLGITALATLIRFVPSDPINTLTSRPTQSHLKSENLQDLPTSELTQIGQKFAQGDLNGAAMALETLLDRNALPEAKQVIAAIPPQQTDTAEISFLRGRILWQSLGSKRDSIAIAEVRSFWQKAVDKDPNSVLYRNALGFTYYAESNFGKAIDTWFEALGSDEESKLNTVDTSAKKQILNNYAGIALALWRIAETQPNPQKQELQQEAARLGSKVIAEGKADFTAQISQDWLWTESAIKDWQTFLEKKSVR